VQYLLPELQSLAHCGYSPHMTASGFISFFKQQFIITTTSPSSLKLCPSLLCLPLQAYPLTRGLLRLSGRVDIRRLFRLPRHGPELPRKTYDFPKLSSFLAETLRAHRCWNRTYTNVDHSHCSSLRLKAELNRLTLLIGRQCPTRDRLVGLIRIASPELFGVIVLSK
jgi:hypothetical protein